MVLSGDIRLQNILPIKVDVVDILVGSNSFNIKKINESVSKKLFTSSQFLCFNKSWINTEVPKKKNLFWEFALYFICK